MIRWIKTYLVDDIQDAWKWYSTRALAVSIALPTIWTSLPVAFQAAIPGGLITAMAIVSIVALVLRMVKQP